MRAEIAFLPPQHVEMRPIVLCLQWLWVWSSLFYIVGTAESTSSAHEGKLASPFRQLWAELEKDNSTQGLIPPLPIPNLSEMNVSTLTTGSTAISLCNKLSRVHNKKYAMTMLAMKICQTTVYMTNVKFSKDKGGFILFQSEKKQQQKQLRKMVLPPIKHIRFRKQSHSRVPVAFSSPHTTFQDSCKGKVIYDGTLHIFGQVTVHNHFHTIQDNILPYYAHVVLDSFVAPEFLMKKRAFLVGLSQPSKTAPHYQILLDSFDDVFHIRSINDMCFRRVLWGNGPRLIYNHPLVLLRKLSANLLRVAVMDLYNLKRQTPYDSIEAVGTTASTTEKLSLSNSLYRRCKDGSRSCKLNVVMYSRAHEKPGRSIQAEEKIISTLNSVGMRALLLSDFSAETMQHQLALATQADVIIGLHGAGLINILFAQNRAILVELKTPYGYKLDLFTLAAEARSALYLSIDIRNYDDGKGMLLPIDKPLITRVTQGLLYALSIQKEGHILRALTPIVRLNDSSSLLKAKTAEDVIVISTDYFIPLKSMSIGGPNIETLFTFCHELPVAVYRNFVGNAEKWCTNDVT